MPAKLSPSESWTVSPNPCWSNAKTAMPRAATRGVEVRVAPNMLRKAMHGDDDGLQWRRVCGY